MNDGMASPTDSLDLAEALGQLPGGDGVSDNLFSVDLDDGLFSEITIDIDKSSSDSQS